MRRVAGGAKKGGGKSKHKLAKPVPTYDGKRTDEKGWVL